MYVLEMVCDLSPIVSKAVVHCYARAAYDIQSSDPGCIVVTLTSVSSGVESDIDIACHDSIFQARWPQHSCAGCDITCRWAGFYERYIIRLTIAFKSAEGDGSETRSLRLAFRLVAVDQRSHRHI